MGNSQNCKETAAKLAADLDCAFFGDCLYLKIEAANNSVLCEKHIYNGNVSAVFKCETVPSIITFTPNIYGKAKLFKNNQAQIKEIRLSKTENTPTKIKVLRHTVKTSSEIPLIEAPVVIGGGRGIGSKETFNMLFELAKLLNGTVGATRPPCDNLWIDEGQQIGVSGKSISPNVYFAIGVSGSKLHTQGLKGSKVIVAINTAITNACIKRCMS